MLKNAQGVRVACNQTNSAKVKYFSNISARRNTALMVLLLWLFALVSGVANACLLEVRETHSHAAAGESVDAAQMSVMLPGHVGAVADDSGVGKAHLTAACLKVCDDGSHSLLTQVSTVAHADPGPALLVMVLWSTTAPDVPALGQIDDEQPATPELPIRVRFSRLAI